MGGEIKEKAPGTYWSDCGRIFFTGGKGYGITSELQTVCLGNETDILKALTDGLIYHNLAPAEHQTLADIIEYRRELSNGEFKPKSPSAIRSRPSGTVKHRTADIRQASPRKRATLYSSKH